MVSTLPTVVLPAGNAPSRLDACLAALENSLPAGATVLVADDASSDPQVQALARGFCERSRLQARYLRSGKVCGWVATCNAALAEAGEADVVLLRPGVTPAAGWLQGIAACAAADTRIATVMAWTDGDELCAVNDARRATTPLLADAIAEAAVRVDWEHCPELPATSGPCLFLRRLALRQVGSLDEASFGSERALDDFGRRVAAMGWKNVLCPTAFVASAAQSQSAMRHDAQSSLHEAGRAARGDELARLVARWPDFQERVARFILDDTLRPMRERLHEQVEVLARSGPQRDLFQ